MCIVQHFSQWQCGCCIDENNQALVSICNKKLRDPNASCTMYVFPACEAVVAPEPREGEHTTPESDTIDDEETESDAAYSAYSYDDRDKPPIGAYRARRLTNDGLKSLNERNKRDSTGNEDHQGDCGEKCRATKTTTSSLAAKRSYEEELLLKKRKHEAEMAVHFLMSPRKCPKHEAKFEHAIRTYWQSEMLWLRPKLRRRGWPAWQDFLFAQRCGDRLWELYSVWKFSNGGDQHGAAIAGSADFCPLRDKSQAVGVDACSTMQRVFYAGVVNYASLHWALDDLLDTLRAMLHPLEMVG